MQPLPQPCNNEQIWHTTLELLSREDIYSGHSDTSEWLWTAGILNPNHPQIQNTQDNGLSLCTRGAAFVESNWCSWSRTGRTFCQQLGNWLNNLATRSSPGYTTTRAVSSGPDNQLYMHHIFSFPNVCSVLLSARNLLVCYGRHRSAAFMHFILFIIGELWFISLFPANCPHCFTDGIQLGFNPLKHSNIPKIDIEVLRIIADLLPCNGGNQQTSKHVDTKKKHHWQIRKKQWNLFQQISCNAAFLKSEDNWFSIQHAHDTTSEWSFAFGFTEHQTPCSLTSEFESGVCVVVPFTVLSASRWTDERKGSVFCAFPTQNGVTFLRDKCTHTKNLSFVVWFSDHDLSSSCLDQNCCELYNHLW